MHAAALFAAINLAIFTTVLHALPVVLAAAFILFGLYGFWRGLSIRPHQEGHRAQPLSKYFWWAND